MLASQSTFPAGIPLKLILGDSAPSQLVDNSNFWIADDIGRQNAPLRRCVGGYSQLVAGHVRNRLISLELLENRQ